MMPEGPIQVRALAPGDLDRLAERLNGWFASYRDHLDYRPDVLAFLDAVLWGDGDVSTVAEHAEHGLVAALLAGARPATAPDGGSLLVAHLGPLAVSPFFRRQGLAARLHDAAAARARSKDVDAITLLTQEIYPAWRFYEAQGYRLIERFQPYGCAIGEVTAHPAVARVDADTWQRARPPREPRAGSVAEGPVAPPPDHPAVPVTWWLAPRGLAGVAVALWPARVRIDGRFEPIVSLELLDGWGEEPAWSATVAAAAAWARDAGADGMYTMPWGAPPVPGMGVGDNPWVRRYALGLTARGAEAVAAATAWDAWPPAP
jgi:ribosomal protein S18 acetylase RimI-like enzyme